MLAFLLVLTVASSVGLQGWRILLNNFAVEWASLDGHHVGIVQSVREVPGFLALLVVRVLLVAGAGASLPFPSSCWSRSSPSASGRSRCSS